MTAPFIVQTAVMLVDRRGWLLMQLRDANAPNFPHVWGLPGGHCEDGERPSQAAPRELWEEAMLIADDGLRLFEYQELPEFGRAKYYYCGATSAGQSDVVLGEGAAMLFISPHDVFDGRRYTPGTKEVLDRFLASSEYLELHGPRAGGPNSRRSDELEPTRASS